MEYSEKTYTIHGTDILVKCARTWDNELPVITGEGQTYNIKFVSEGGTVEDDLEVEVINLPDAGMSDNYAITGYFYDEYNGNQLALLISYARPLDVGGETICYEGGPRIHFTGTDTWTGGSYTYVAEEVSNYRIYVPIHGTLGQSNGGTYTRASLITYCLASDV